MSFASWLKLEKAHAKRVRGRRHTFAPRLEALEDRLAPATFTVVNTNDSGPGSLRQAIFDANASLAVFGTDRIVFNMAAGDPGHVYYRDNGGAGVSVANLAVTSASSDADILDKDPHHPHSWWSIKLLTALPSLTTAGGPVEIDGTSQPGASANTLAVGNDAVLGIELDGSNLVTGTGLNFNAGGSTLQGLVINRFVTSTGAIRVSVGSGTQIKGNFIGTDVSGTLDLGNSSAIGVLLAGNTVGGTDPGARNVVSGNHIGISVSQAADSTTIQGNYIGTNAQGKVALKNDLEGISFGGDNGLIGGTAPGAGNVISGNAGTAGIVINSGATGTRIEGNLIGTNAEGTAAVPNTGSGISLAVGGITVGGTASGAGNVISGNLGNGLVLQGVIVVNPLSYFVQGNWIGTQKDGVNPLGNALNGVLIPNSTQNNNHMVGGLAPGAGNVIAFNGKNGVGHRRRHRPCRSRQLHPLQRAPGDQSGDGIQPPDAERPGRR